VAHLAYRRAGEGSVAALCADPGAATMLFESLGTARAAGLEICPACLDPNVQSGAPAASVLALPRPPVTPVPARRQLALLPRPALAAGRARSVFTDVVRFQRI
jgi:hypothetical protein